MTGIFDEMKCQNIVDIVKQLSQLNTEEHQNNNYNGVEGHRASYLRLNNKLPYFYNECVCACTCARACVCVYMCMCACMHVCLSLFSYLCMYPLHKQMKNFCGTRTRVLG